MQLLHIKMNMKKTSMISSKNKNQPIGVFDSGLGGLTVLKYLLEKFPNQDFIYLGDLANLPYGNKSKNKIINYGIKCAKFLESKHVQSIIIACNTASSYALKSIEEEVNVPVFDVISPCVKQVAYSKCKKIAILGTEKTIESNIYSKLIHAINSKIEIYNKACPLFVPIVEEGLENSLIAMNVVDFYLSEIKKQKIEKIILGCTHYPILLDSLNKYFDNSVQILHSGPVIANNLESKMQSNNQGHSMQKVSYYVTDLPQRFQKFGNKFLDCDINKVELVEL